MRQHVRLSPDRDRLCIEECGLSLARRNPRSTPRGAHGLVSAMKLDASNESLARRCEELLPATLEFLREMVAINSFTENVAGVNRVGALVAEHFAPMGFSAEFVQAGRDKCGRHLVMKRMVRQAGPTVALLSHLDTVFTEEEEARNNFAWRVEGTRIYGPGTNDIKGGTAAIWMLLEALRVAAPEVFETTNWVVLLNACEEVDSDDFGNVCRANLPANTMACLVFEGDGGGAHDYKLVAARKGRAHFRVNVSGRSSHAGSEHKRGANAITQLASVITDLAGITDYAAAVTVNVGVVEGGTVTNRVPHTAKAELEMRAFDPVAFDEARRKILAWNRDGDVASVEGDPFRCRVTVEQTQESEPWPRNSGSDRLFSIWMQTGDDLGLQVSFEERGGLSDGNVMWDFCPTLDGLGPRGESCHCSEHNPAEGKEQEWVDVPSFVPKTVWNATALLRLLAETRDCT